METKQSKNDEILFSMNHIFADFVYANFVVMPVIAPAKLSVSVVA